MVKIGIIGGSGLDDPKFLKEFKEIEVDTPFGKPSSKLTTGKLGNHDVVILARHGKGHTIMPTNVNFRANVWALKEQGVSHIVATTACGSLRQQIEPGDFVFIDQFIDRTTQRKSSFYERDKVCHIPMVEPFCHKLRILLSDTARELDFKHHDKGTMITIEGPRFSTRAESHMFRQWGADVINMSLVPEVILAREAGICYASIAMSTDYDCWHKSEEPVTWEMIINTMNQNAENVKKLILKVIPKINYMECQCREDIKTAVIGGD